MKGFNPEVQALIHSWAVYCGTVIFGQLLFSVLEIKWSSERPFPSRWSPSTKTDAIGTFFWWASQAALVVMNSPAHAWDLRDLGLGRYAGGGHSHPLQFSCLENPMDRGAWWATIHRVVKTQTQLRWLSTHARTYRQILCYCASLCRYCFFLFFTKWMFMITQLQQVYGCHLSNSICSLHVSVSHFDNSQCFTLFHYYICYGGLWSVTFDVANMVDWRLIMIVWQ